MSARDVEWVLNVPVTDPNWRTCLNRLTDEELLFCLQHATGVTKRRRLEAYARKRKLLCYEGGDPGR